MNELNKIVAITSQALEVPTYQLCESTDLFSDLRIDSIDLLMLVVKLEEAYNMELSGDQVSEIETIADLVYLFTKEFAYV